jgi:hypothetical protein
MMNNNNNNNKNDKRYLLSTKLIAAESQVELPEFDSEYSRPKWIQSRNTPWCSSNDSVDITDGGAEVSQSLTALVLAEGMAQSYLATTSDEPEWAGSIRTASWGTFGVSGDLEEMKLWESNSSMMRNKSQSTVVSDDRPHVRFTDAEPQVYTYEKPPVSLHPELYYSCHQLQKMMDEYYDQLGNMFQEKTC